MPTIEPFDPMRQRFGSFEGVLNVCPFHGAIENSGS